MDKKVIITGANSGIGKAATFKFAKEGYKVVMACRDLKNGKEVQEEIKSKLGNVSIDLMEVDMGSFESINNFCENYKNNYDALDILIHNAGCFNHGAKAYQKSEDNLELTFAVNVFGPYLMTMLLKDSLAKSKDPRVLGASSINILHFFDEGRVIDFENLLGEQKTDNPYNAYKMYGDSKMAFGMVNERISEVFKEEGIKVNSLMITGVKLSKRTMKKFSFSYKFLAYMQNLFLRPTDFMANNYFQICTSEKFKNVTGKLISDKRDILVAAPEKLNLGQNIKELFIKNTFYPRYADNKEIQDKLWSLCEEVCFNKIAKGHINSTK